MPSPDYRTKGQTDEKELFHILPELQVKRDDFLTVMLTGTLLRRWTFATPPPIEAPEPQGPRDDDVTRSESKSEASQKSSERSQDGAPSTLIAEDQKVHHEPVLAADVDPDMEDASKTLVLFSPGDTHKSPSGVGDHNFEVDLGTPSAVTPRNETPSMWEMIQLDHSEPAGLSATLRSDLRPPISIAPASPPFTKVERTFIHIAETSHLNVMSSRSQTAKESNHDLLAITQALAGRDIHEQRTHLTAEPQAQSATDKPNVPPIIGPLVSDSSIDEFKKQPTEIEASANPQGNGTEPELLEPVGLPVPPKPRTRSRIPVLVSEGDTGSERSSSLSARVRLQRRAEIQRRAVQLDLARLVVEKQQGRWMRRRVISGTSSSLSSGDERRRASETLSNAGSEEDPHDSEESLARSSCHLNPSGGQGSEEWRSRIPRPVTPIKRPSGRLVAATALSHLSLPGSGICRAATFIGNGLQTQKVGLGTLHIQRRSKTMPIGSASSSCHRPSPGPGPDQPCGSLRTPQFCVFANRRSFSTSHCRTDSPSPQRVHPIRQPLSVRPSTAPPPRPRTMTTVQRSASQDPATQLSTTTAARARPQSTRPGKAKQSTENKWGTAR